MTDGASSPGTQPTRARDAEAPLPADLATTPLPRGGRSAPLTLAGVLFIFVGSADWSPRSAFSSG